MEILMIMLGFATALLVVPPKVSKTLQRAVRRKVGHLIRKNTNKKDSV
ncbi:hypothetical protein SB749_15020 [Brevibacterium sp. SIMBA_078]